MRTFAQKQNPPQQKSSLDIAKSNTMVPAASHQAYPSLHLQRTIGNQAVPRSPTAKPGGLEVGFDTEATTRFAHDFSRTPVHAKAQIGIQPKLVINTPGDIYEQEADQLAEQVMRMPDPKLERACACGGGCPRCQTQQPSQEHQHLQTKHVGSSDSGQTAAPPIVHEVLASPGQPLDTATRAFMEPRFGYDFRQVRIHAGREAAGSSRSIGAAAYTVGQNIVFGEGRYAPAGGQRLLAHELAHVIQQGAAGTRPAGVRNSFLNSPVGVAATDEVAGRQQSDSSGSTLLSHALKPGVAAIMLQRQKDDPRALTTETIDEPRHWRVSEWLVENAPGGSSKTEAYWVDFEVDAKGVLRASVRTVSPDRTYRSGRLRFGASFRAALQKFQARGVEVNALEGDWSYMNATEVSDNLRVFGEGIGAGKTREAAAEGTPTGKVATRSGFKVTSIENVPESQEHLADEGLRRWRVRAVFTRVSPEAKPGSTRGGNLTPGRGPVTPPADDSTKSQTGAGGKVTETPTEVGTPSGTPKRLTGSDGEGPAPPAGLSLRSSVIRVGTDVGLAFLVSLISDYLNAKIKAHFDKKYFQQRMEALQPAIDAMKEKALADAPAQRRALINKRQFYWIIELRISVHTAVTTRMAVPGAPTPELLSVRISESDTGSEGPVESAKPIVAPAQHAVILLEDSQMVTYSEPIVSWHYDYGVDLKSNPFQKNLKPQGQKANLDVLRFSQTGKEVTMDSLVAWAKRNFPAGIADPRVLKNIYASHEFEGSDDARARAAEAIVQKLREEKAKARSAQ